MEKVVGETTKSRTEPVVLTGISCRLPESGNVQEFRDNLMNNVDMITTDDRRWKSGRLKKSVPMQYCCKNYKIR